MCLHSSQKSRTNNFGSNFKTTDWIKGGEFALPKTTAVDTKNYTITNELFTLTQARRKTVI